jgi:putative transposase
MPAKNSLKVYLENGIYHIYNRGVNKQKIFSEDKDYGVFLSYLKTYLLPKDEKGLYQRLLNPSISYQEKDEVLKLLRLNNFSDEITLFAYCLMPNHFHLLLKQNSPMAIDNFMESLGTRYTMFYNKKYKRVGSLCQAVYKAVMVNSDEQLLYLSNYIHRNPLPEYYKPRKDLITYLVKHPSSLGDYLDQRKTKWLHPEVVLNYFSKTNKNLDYASFVKQADDFTPVSSLLIDL